MGIFDIFKGNKKDGVIKEYELTKDLLNTLSVDEIIYAEVTRPGGMGNVGGIRISIIKDEKLVTYTTNYYTDENTYFAVVDLLRDSCIHNNDIQVDKIIFDYYRGGWGNHVYVNKNITLKIGDRYFTHGDCYFIYNRNNKEYHVLSSVDGVFINVVDQMQNSRP
jgi:hypothetical protein